jgi:hypothetical protein
MTLEGACHVPHGFHVRVPLRQEFDDMRPLTPGHLR